MSRIITQPRHSLGRSSARTVVSVVGRMLELMRLAAEHKGNLRVFPELAHHLLSALVDGRSAGDRRLL
jgi:hypothetical protein